MELCDFTRYIVTNFSSYFDIRGEDFMKRLLLMFFAALMLVACTQKEEEKQVDKPKGAK